MMRLTLATLLTGALGGSHLADIPTTAVGTGTHTVLVAALTGAGLVATLEGTGPFTVFAPTDAAFVALLAELDVTQADLLERTDLADILTYHVVSGKVMGADLEATQSPATVQGNTMTVTKDANGVKVNDRAMVTAADVECSNGVIHVVDKVLLGGAEGPGDIVEEALGSPEHTVLVAALTTAKLVETLKGTGPFTVFAPHDAAFTALLTDLGATKEELLARSDLGDILKYHVVSGKVMGADLEATQSPATVQGATVTITMDSTGVKVNGDAEVTVGDIECSNGVIHVIDKVLLPPPATTAAPDGDSHASAAVALLALLAVA